MELGTESTFVKGLHLIQILILSITHFYSIGNRLLDTLGFDNVNVFILWASLSFVNNILLPAIRQQLAVELINVSSYVHLLFNNILFNFFIFHILLSIFNYL